ncbi:MAG: hypothetical protein AB7I36_05040 [Rhodospirillaceae bacterium]
MDVFQHFACHTKLPVLLKDVYEHVFEHAGMESINFYQTELDTSIIGGFVRVFRWRERVAPYASADKCTADVFLGAGLSPEWRRVVAVKEMIHLLDGHEQTSRTRERVSALITEMCLPFQAVQASLPGMTDRFGLLPALAILLPRDALDYLRPQHVAKNINDEAVAQLARIPAEMVPFLMTDAWKGVLENFDDGK